ncbi:MAG TPA: dephospho-CoA kinase [Planctomycetaceae bacterium]|nr:dephospho-CoA kinase [Planctomycetaceae bacterium]
MTNAPRRIPVIGLVGGIGSGKSHLARQLCERHPIEIVEGDPAGHLVLHDSEVKQSLRKAFGDGIFAPDGEIDRQRLGRLVFGPSPDQIAARSQLEQFVHPKITEILTRQIALARARPDIEAVILDAALLLEAGWRHLCDAVVFIDTSLEQRLARVAKGRGWTRDDLRLREESQLPLEKKRKEADYVLENFGDGQGGLSRLEEVYARILSSAR